MTESNIDPAVIKKTQEILGKFVKKPILTDKLLRKPPFRFLHDIITAVIRDTGYFSGLFTDTQLNSDNIKDRDAKIQFLQKIIDVIKLSVDKNLSVRPSKIVAGQEPEKTNELLQLIGALIEKQIDCNEAIELVKLGDSKQKPDKAKGEKVGGKQQKPDKVKTEKAAELKSKTDKGSRVKDAKIPEKGVKVKNDKTKVKEKEKEKIRKVEKPQRKLKETKEVDKSKERTVNAREVSLEKEFAPVVESSTKIGREQVEEKTQEQSLDTSIPAEPSLVSANKDNNENQIKSATKSNKRSAKQKVDEEKPTQVNRESPPTQENNDLPEIETTKSKVAEDSKLEKPQEEVSQTRSIKSGEKEPPMGDLIDIIDQEAKSRQKDSERRKSSGKRKQSLSDATSTEEKPRRSSKKSSKRQESIVENENVKKPESEVRPVTDVSSTENDKKPEAERKNSVPTVTENTPELKRQSTFVRENSDVGARPRTSLRPPSARPPSARPGAPRRRDKNVEIVLQPNEQVKMAGISVKLDNLKADLEEDEGNLVIFEDPNIQEMDIRGLNEENTEVDSSQQGYLVQQILETQKQLLPSKPEEAIAVKDWDVGMSQRHQTSEKSMSSLRDAIQILARSINPLGKLMDFIPEDMDSMQMELKMWRDAYVQASNELKKERNLTESSIEPMKQQLGQINSTIKEYVEMIDNSRSRILQNSEKINKLFTEY